MRLIDADALDREMYRKSFEVDDGRNVWNSGLWIRYKIYEEAVRDAPTIDAVPVIRCGGCVHFKQSEVLGNTCALTDNHVTKKDYCSKAERKENGK